MGITDRVTRGQEWWEHCLLPCVFYSFLGSQWAPPSVSLLTVPPKMAPMLIPCGSPSSAPYGPWHPWLQERFSPHHAQPFWWSGCTFAASSLTAWLRALFSILLSPMGRGSFISQSSLKIMSYLPKDGVLGQPNMGQWAGCLLAVANYCRDSLISWVLSFTREQHTMASWWSPHWHSSTSVMSSYLAFVGTVCKKLIFCSCRMGSRCVGFSWSGHLCFIVALNWRWNGPLCGPIKHLVFILFAAIHITRNHMQLQCCR